MAKIALYRKYNMSLFAYLKNKIKHKRKNQKLKNYRREVDQSW